MMTLTKFAEALKQAAQPKKIAYVVLRPNWITVALAYKWGKYAGCNFQEFSHHGESLSTLADNIKGKMARVLTEILEGQGSPPWDPSRNRITVTEQMPTHVYGDLAGESGPSGGVYIAVGLSIRFDGPSGVNLTQEQLGKFAQEFKTYGFAVVQKDTLPL